MKFFDIAKKMAKKSDHPDYKIGGCIVNRSKVISLGFNRYKTSPRSNHPFNHIHCELDCILGVDENILRGCSIYLYRETKNGDIAKSKPCVWCNKLLKSVGISVVYYTDYNDSFRKEAI